MEALHGGIWETLHPPTLAERNQMVSRMGGVAPRCEEALSEALIGRARALEADGAGEALRAVHLTLDDADVQRLHDEFTALVLLVCTDREMAA